MNGAATRIRDEKNWGVPLSGHAVECVEQAVVIALGDRIVLVIVALSARHGQAQPGRGGRVDRGRTG